jgi:hypothetical protein
MFRETMNAPTHDSPVRLYILLAAAALIAAGGCSKEPPARAGPRISLAAPAMAPPAPRAQESGRRTLAYEHTIDIETDADKVVPAFSAAQASCKESVAAECVVLEAKIDTGEFPYAHLRFRAKPEGIRKIDASLSAQGDVTDRATTAEDLARPLEDTARRLDMLQDYRQRLEALRGKASSDIEPLIKVNKELAQVQSDIEALTGERARLTQRVETEILTVSISSDRRRALWTPMRVALSEFGSNLSAGIASVVTAMAYILPWSLVLLGFTGLARGLWLRWRRRRTGSR